MWRVLCGFVLGCSLLASSLAGVSPAFAQDSTSVPAPGVAADASGMEPITEPWVDPDATLDDAFGVSIEFDPVATGIEGTTQLQPGEFKLLPADVALADFYAEVSFQTPAIPEGGQFSVGFCFWVDTAGNCYDVYLQFDTEGNAFVGSGYLPIQDDYRSLTVTGTLAALPADPTPGVENVLGIAVYHGYAILAGNDFDALVAIALPDAALAGKVKAQIGFVDGGSTANGAPLPVTITDLEVWDLSSGLAPAFDWTDDPTPAAPSMKPMGEEAGR